jgi:hypothetical protein
MIHSKFSNSEGVAKGNQMRLNQIGILAVAILVVSTAAFAQAPSTGQWTIIASNETSLNTLDGGPLQFITDWKSSNGNSNSATIAPVLANSFTNSSCSESGQPAALTVTFSSGKTSVVVTLDNGQQVIFSGHSGGTSSQFSGSFVSTGGGCTQADSGNFTATLYQSLQGSFSGTIESYAQTNTINVMMDLGVDANFNIVGSVHASNQACMSNLIINGRAAQAYGPSFASGDVEEIFASDNNGNVVGFVLSATDANGNFLSPAWPSQVYVTYDVLAGACSGDAGTDAPFHKVQKTVNHAPIHLPIHRGRLMYGLEYR